MEAQVADATPAGATIRVRASASRTLARVALGSAAVAIAIAVVAATTARSAAPAAGAGADSKSAPASSAQSAQVVEATWATVASVPARPQPAPVATTAAPQPGATMRAKRFLAKQALGKDIVEQVLHVGATFTSKSFRGVRTLENGEGQPTAYFAVDYRYRWSARGWTDVAYICNGSGLVTGLQLLKSNGEEEDAPFAKANANVAAFGALLIGLVERDSRSTPDDTAAVRELVNAGDVGKLIDVYLAVAQRLDEAV
jgi:hypothetical protein